MGRTAQSDATRKQNRPKNLSWEDLRAACASWAGNLEGLMQIWQSVQIKKKKIDLNSAQARVHPLWTPYTPYYSFLGIIGGFRPYLQRAEMETSLRGVSVKTANCVSAPARFRRRSQSPQTWKAPQRNRWGVLQHVTRRYHSNCSCLCWMLNPPRAAERARICLSGARSRRAHLCLISRPHIQ